MSERHVNDNPDDQRERLFELARDIWEDGSETDGPSKLTVEEMARWHKVLRKGSSDAGKLRNPHIKKRTRSACRRLHRGLEPAFDPYQELHRITLPIAQFLIDANEIKPFSSAWESIEVLSVQKACRFAGCLPPNDYGDSEWERLLIDERDVMAKPVRTAAIAQLLFERISAAMDGAKGEI